MAGEGPVGRRSSYDKYPEVRVDGYDDQAFHGKADVYAALSGLRGASTVTVDCYPGVTDDVLDLVRRAVDPDVVIMSELVYLDQQKVDAILAPHVTQDRVRGVMFYGCLEDLMDPEQLDRARSKVQQAVDRGLRVMVYGVGASVVCPGDVLVYCDLARWEIQQRYRHGACNFLANNAEEDALRKFKRGYFIDWRIADRHKRQLFDRIDYLLDSNDAGDPRLITGDAFRAGLDQVVRRPFRLVPYFDPGVWGGTWMRDHFGLDPAAPNYAWSFDGVPEENSLYLRFGDVRVEVPAMDAVLRRPMELLGAQNYARFGAEFPIRFDLLDTMGGQNLSLQVHPLTDYIHTHYGMAYTQDESYYILDAQPGAGVYLGLREGVSPARMMAALRAAQDGGPAFSADMYVNRVPAHRHDHFLIPAGTVHCSSAGCMVLEISATPYIFTYKLWDWGRLGLDGKPRPIHLDDGEKNIQWNRRTDWVQSNLVNQFRDVAAGDGWTEEHTGLHELEFIESRRFTSTVTTQHDASRGVHMLNLVEGDAAVVQSPTGAFEPFEVHYAETFIVPAAAGSYTVRPAVEGQQIRFVQAYVRQVG